MKRIRIGTLHLRKEGLTLRYYLLGSRRSGYGLEVEQLQNGIITGERCMAISRSRRVVHRLGREVLRGAVLPGYLAEIASEWQK